MKLRETLYIQNNFCSHIENKLKSRTTCQIQNSRTTYTNVYTLTVNKEKLKVCREFFMATLNVTDAFMRSALSKRSSTGASLKDSHGKHAPSNKLTHEDDNVIQQHILSFPSVESHYCRKSSTKKYLDPSLNISIMHRMYKEMCRNKNFKPVSFEKYRLTFREYNLGFFQPKKDQCKVCLAHEGMAKEEKATNEPTLFKEHQERKTASRAARDEDKKVAKEDPTALSFNFDLQSVLTTPKGSAN